MPAPTNPFPGMNPFFQRTWGDVRNKLITYLSDALSEELPRELSARAEASVEIIGGDEPQNDRADVAVTESWREGVPPLWKPERSGGNPVAVADTCLHRRTGNGAVD